MKYMNLLFQLLWVCVALIIGSYISSSFFESLLWQCVFSGIFSLLAYFLLYFVSNYIKAFKDPDVRAASSLVMSVNRYRWYRQHYDEWQEAMTKYGTDSKEANKVFDEFFPKIKNLNEWRRYQEYRFNETKTNMFNSLNKLYDN